MRPGDARLLAIVAALWVGLAGLIWGTFVAGGADAYGYVSQATLWLEGDLVQEHPIDDPLPWPEVDATLTPLGYRPGLELGTTVPVYPVGLPLVMASLQAVGGPLAVYFAVPLLGAVLVLATAALAGRAGGPTAAGFAAVLLALSPTLLYSVTWPMSDVAATAWWAVAIWAVGRGGPRAAAGGGVATALAVMTRPNLVGVGLVPFAILAMEAWRHRTRASLVRLAWFAGPAAAGCFAVAAVHTVLYGSPLASGHGDLGTFFDAAAPATTPVSAVETAVASIWRPVDNVLDFLGRLITIEPALTLGAAAGLAVAARPGASASERTAGVVGLGLIGTVFASYAYFNTFSAWWFLRLLLPAYPALALLSGLAVAFLVDRLGGILRPVVLTYLVIACGWFGVSEVLEREVHFTWINESRYVRVGDHVRRMLPPDAVLITAQQSGSLRHYTDRPIVRFDTMHAEWLEPAVDHLREIGYTPYFVVEDHERDLFIGRFASVTPLGALDWPPRVAFEGPTAVWIFDPRDRARQDAGDEIQTERVILERVELETDPLALRRGWPPW